MGKTFWTALLSALLLLGGSGCDKQRKDPTTHPIAEAEPAEVPPPCGPTSESEGALRWFQDDYAAAASCASKLDKPLLIDMWALWCHTCLSMKHFVLVDPSLAPLAERFVWLAIDTDK